MEILEAAIAHLKNKIAKRADELHMDNIVLKALERARGEGEQPRLPIEADKAPAILPMRLHTTARKLVNTQLPPEGSTMEVSAEFVAGAVELAKAIIRDTQYAGDYPPVKRQKTPGLTADRSPLSSAETPGTEHETVDRALDTAHRVVRCYGRLSGNVWDETMDGVMIPGSFKEGVNP